MMQMLTIAYNYSKELNAFVAVDLLLTLTGHFRRLENPAWKFTKAGNFFC